MTARKLHFADTLVHVEDLEAQVGAADAVLCEQKPKREGDTLWATTDAELADCAKCVKRLAERAEDANELSDEEREIVETPAEIVEEPAAEIEQPAADEPEIAPVVEIKTKRERKAKAEKPAAEPTDESASAEQKRVLRAFNSGANYAANAARYGDADKALLRYTKRRERQGNPAPKSELDAFAEGYADAAAKLAAK